MHSSCGLHLQPWLLVPARLPRVQHDAGSTRRVWAAAGPDGKLMLPVDTWDPFPSQLAPPRRIDIVLPPGYHDPVNEQQRYPVVYMHDGQNCVHPHLSFTRVDWGVDAALTQLAAGSSQVALPPICVLLWNQQQQRRQEYMPAAPLRWLQGYQECWFDSVEPDYYHPTSDAYLDMLVGEVKPAVDAAYRTQPGQGSTHLVGSSMGGLVSLAGLIRHPQVFGGAGCLSTHWVPGSGLVVGWLADGATPTPGPHHKLYFDHGTEGLDADYGPYQRRVDDLMAAAGWRGGEGGNYCSRVFPGAGHNEAAWRERLPQVLAWLLSPTHPGHQGEAGGGGGGAQGAAAAATGEQ